MKRLLIISLFFAVVGQACLVDPDCVTTTANYINVNFYDYSTNQRDTLVMRRISAIGSDSLIAEQDTISGVTLPLDPKQPFVTYVFDSNIGLDTLILSYDLGTRMISEECGLEFIYTELDYTRSDFDSISVVNQIPLETINEDVKIFN